MAVRVPVPAALEIILAGAARIVRVSDDEVKAAVRHYYGDTHNLVEGAGAAGEDERARTLFGLLVCSATTILVFGVLAWSSIPVLHAIGMTAAVGSCCCLLFAGMMAKPEAASHA